MNPLDDLLQRLNAADPEGWEDEYARHRVELTRDEAFAIVTAGPAYAEWFAFRSDAGPPGVPLPPMEQAVDAVLRGKDGTPLDAYRVVFSPRPPTDELPAGVILAVLCNSVACALKRGTTWFGTWLASRAGLAAVALGAPERAWTLLHALTIDGERHPLLDKLAIFEPIRGNPALERNPWIRAAICRLWPALGVPIVPHLPFPSLAETEGTTLEATLDELSRVGADHVCGLVKSHADAMDRATVEAHEDHPLVRDLRARAMVTGSSAPAPGELPPWFEDWARGVARTGEVRLARLAGLVLHHAGVSDPSLVAGLVLRAMRAADLSVLSTGLNAPELQSSLDELAAAADALPEAVADALVAIALPGHVDGDKSLPVLVQNIELLTNLEKTPGGIVERISGEIYRAMQDLAQEHVEARPHLEQFLAAVRRAAARLGDARLLVAEDVERAVQTLDVPNLTTGLLELAVEAKGLEPLERLILALALSHAVMGTEHATRWRTRLLEMASHEIYEQRTVALFALRLTLLDEIIAAADPPVSRAEAHYQRANTRRALAPSDPLQLDRALADLRTAMRLARAEGNPSLCARATAMWAKTLAWLEADEDRHQSDSIDEAKRVVAQASELPLKPFHRAELLQARAHLLRVNEPQEAARALEQAQALISEEDPFWAELVSELVTTLVRTRQPEEAAMRGMAAIERASCAMQQTSLGMLHVAVGEALVASHRHVEARQQLEAGLALVRGHDPYNAQIAHDRLARLGIETGERELAEEHLRHLRDRRDALDIATRRDLSYLEAAAARVWGNADEQRSAWHEVLSLAHDDAERVRIRLELARVDLAAGREAAHLDALVAQAVALPADATSDALVTDLVYNYGAPLSPPTGEAVVRWAMHRGRPSVAARVHHRAGRAEDARTLLREALSGELRGHERLACVHLLATMLKPDAREERRQLCAELERLLEEVRDEPHARLDLAAALRVDADGAPDVLWRAWRHAQRGLQGVQDDHAVAHGHRTLGRIIVDLVRASLPESSKAQAELASWFLEERSALKQELAQFRLRARNLPSGTGSSRHSETLISGA
jgi:tetratricopeptide (TPR) repeat protein